MSIRLLIVGFDPGVKVGLVLLDTFGRVVLLNSKSQTNIAQLSQTIIKYGKPIIVATDRKPIPRSVEKLARSLGAKIYVPIETMTVKEKIDLVKKYDISVKNNHERDAAAAALKAYKHYSQLFKKVNISLNSLGLNSIYDKVVQSLIFGEADNLDEAINKSLIKPKEIEIVKQEKHTKTEKHIDINRLERDLEILRKYNQKLLEEVEILRKKTKVKIVVDREKLNELKNNLDLLKKLRRFEVQGKIPLIEVSSNNAEVIDEKIDLFGRVVICKEDSLEFLNKYQIKACVTTKSIDRSKLDFPVIELGENQIKSQNGISYIDANFLEEKLKEARKIGLVEWLKDYRRRKV